MARRAALPRRTVTAIFDRLDAQHPNATTELHYRNPYELLVATILSAQSTDAGVNTVTPRLFARYPDARTLASATTDQLEPMIYATGFFRAKSRSLLHQSTAASATAASGPAVWLTERSRRKSARRRPL